MAVFKIPLQSIPQKFYVSICGVRYGFTLKWNGEGDSGWVLDISGNDGAPLINGISLVTGTDLLRPYKYLMNAGLFLWSDLTQLPPGYDTLGIDINLYFSTGD